VNSLYFPFEKQFQIYTDPEPLFEEVISKLTQPVTEPRIPLKLAHEFHTDDVDQLIALAEDDLAKT